MLGSAQTAPASSPVVAQPIAQPMNDGAIAPWPSIDKTGPIVIGPGLSLSYISAVFRISMQGYRQSYVDLLDEMLEKDPHAFSVLSKRVMGVSSGRLIITPAEVEAGTLDEELAIEIAKVTGDMIAAIPAIEERLTELSWALYYGIVGEEIHWVRDGSGWIADRLSLVHSRRLSYPISGSWDLCVWDQGQVFTDWARSSQTHRISGTRVAAAPGKFIIHAPQIRGGYPTRNGLGRQIAYWMALKLVASRGAPAYLERYANPVPEATYQTEIKDAKRVASDGDVADAKMAMAAMGAGTLKSWVHADTVAAGVIAPDTSPSKLTFAEWIAICDAQTSKAVSGNTLGTDVGHAGGNRALGETQRKGEIGLYKHDAGMMAASLKRDLVSAIVRLNFPKAPARLYPGVKLHVEDDPDPMHVIERASKGAAAGLPVDADAVAEQAGLPLIKAGDINARRLFPIMAQKDPGQFDEDLAARAADIATKVPPPTAATDGVDGASTDEGDGAKPTDGEEAIDEEDGSTSAPPPPGDEPDDEED
jgi:phage gp29-like protein